MQINESDDAAGWAINRWCKSANISRQTFYNLPPDMKPKSVHILGRHIIRESPSEYLCRMAEREQ